MEFKYDWIALALTHSNIPQLLNCSSSSTDFSRNTIRGLAVDAPDQSLDDLVNFMHYLSIKINISYMQCVRPFSAHNGYTHSLEVYIPAAAGDTRLFTLACGHHTGNYVQIVVTGDSCPLVFPVLKKFVELNKISGRVQRIDIAYDLIDHPQLTFDELVNYAFDNVINIASPLFKISTNLIEDVIVSNGEKVSAGRTQYLGSRSSLYFLRIYEKGKQLGLPCDWARVELEFKPGKLSREFAERCFWPFFQSDYLFFIQYSSWVTSYYEWLLQMSIGHVNPPLQSRPMLHQSLLHMMMQYKMLYSAAASFSSDFPRVFHNCIMHIAENSEMGKPVDPLHIIENYFPSSVTATDVAPSCTPFPAPLSELFSTNTTEDVLAIIKDGKELLALRAEKKRLYDRVRYLEKKIRVL